MATYVIHFCKHVGCNNAWLDEDLTRAKKPPRWKYCEACVLNRFINPAIPPRNEKISALSKAKWAQGQIRPDRQTSAE